MKFEAFSLLILELGVKFRGRVTTNQRVHVTSSSLINMKFSWSTFRDSWC